MKFALALAFTDLDEYCDLARTADDCGWEYLALSDHVVHPETIRSPYPYTPDGRPRWEPDAPWADPWVAVGAMASVTHRIRFVTNIYVLAMRNPLAAAKAIGTAAVLSRGRLTLGVGVGWMKDEFQLMGQDFHTRGKRTDEMIEILRKLWSGEMVEHHGSHYEFDRLQMSPAVPHRIPIYVGGLSDAALRRAGRLGDGWVSDLHRIEELVEIRRRIEGHRRDAGRDGDFDMLCSAVDAFDLDGYRRARDAGVTHLMTQPWLFYAGPGCSAQDRKDGVRRFTDEVIAKL